MDGSTLSHRASVRTSSEPSRPHRHGHARSAAHPDALRADRHRPCRRSRSVGCASRNASTAIPTVTWSSCAVRRERGRRFSSRNGRDHTASRAPGCHSTRPTTTRRPSCGSWSRRWSSSPRTVPLPSVGRHRRGHRPRRAVGRSPLGDPAPRVGHHPRARRCSSPARSSGPARSGPARRASPDDVRLVLISRSKPRLGLERARLRGDLVEVTPAAMRFERAEIELLTSTWTGRQFDAAALEQETLGWAAGLRLAQLEGSTGDAPPATWPGSDGVAGDYVREEVIDRVYRPRALVPRGELLASRAHRAAVRCAGCVPRAARPR